MGCGPRPAGRAGPCSRCHREGEDAPTRGAGRVTPCRKTGIQARLPPASLCCPGQDQSHLQQEQAQASERLPGDSPCPHQRVGPRGRRVRPAATWRACHRSTCGRSQRLGRPGPRSSTGRGISGYRRWYWLTVFRWASPRMRATSCASMRSSRITRRGMLVSLHLKAAMSYGCWLVPSDPTDSFGQNQSDKRRHRRCANTPGSGRDP